MASMSLQAAYDQARQWLETNDLDRAIGLAEHILEHYPNNLEAYRILGEAHLANRQLDRAQDAFGHVLRSDPENIPAHVGMGITYERQGKLDSAMVEFEQALEIKPDMAELRNQLLRLYTEAWGSERPLRLSRAGLARLYAKGHMLPQAINEFRQVIADQPGRVDAMVALAETLWRDEQEEEAMTLCREILAQRPESLKANLILGYLEMASGRPTGERYWQTAAQMDPYYGVARALFDTLPPSVDTQPQIEEWDEEAWRRRRLEEQQEQVAATRPMEVMSPAVSSPSDHFQNNSWLTTPSSKPSSAARSSVAGDDFLASLLALDVPARPLDPLPQPVAEEEDLDLGMVPFSLDDLDGESSPPRAAATRPLDEPVADEPGMSPFSLADLGLSDDEIASLDSLGTTPATPAEPPSLAFDLPTFEPPTFEPPNPPAEPPARSEQPPAMAEPIEDEPTMAPFSLADLGLSEDEIAGLDSLGGEIGGQPASEPFSFQEPPRTHTPPAPPPLEPALPDDQIDFGDLPLDLQPFSFDELDLGGESGSKADIGGLPPALQPFSLEDTPVPPPQRPRMSGFTSEESFENVTEEEDDIIPDSRGYSWQQPSHKPQTGFLKPRRDQVEAEGEESSIFAKMKQRRRDEPEIPPEPLAPVSLGEEEHLGLFSLDDISLRDDTDATPPAATIQPVESAPAPQAKEAAPVVVPPAPVSPPVSKTPDIESLDDALSSGEVQPFSLADLGLSEEEIALLGMGDASTPLTSPDLAAPSPLPEVQPPAPPEPATSLDLDLDDQFDFDAPTSAAPPEPAPPAPKEEVDEGPALTSDLQPFSLADLGLSDDEIIALGLGPSTEPEDPTGSELGITEEELEGLDLGDLGWGTPPPPATPEPAPAEPGEPADQVISGDLVVDSLIALGRQQGYVDISDIIAGVEDPEAEAARIEEIGRLLHEANIEIRDGDEVIDMDAEYAEEEEEYSEPAEDWPTAIPAAPAEPEMTPFSLSDLGLSEDEIASLGLGETAPSQPGETPAAPAEPEMTPFSLSDLGLSEDEIAALGLGETASSQPSTPEPPATPDEPVMTPFSLSDLGLSDDEIASVGGTETPAEEPAAPAEPEMTPFSLSDLGLSDHEIASLGGTETPAEEPAAPEEPAMTPFSLSDLGLSDEEIAALGLGEGPQPGTTPEAIPADTPAQPSEPEPPAAPEEPVMTPFSLSDLGLSDEEIAALGLGESAPAQPSETPAIPAEPEMTPFSLNDLGLSDDEIASLGDTETPAEAPSAPAEPVMTPFSLSDLGLSDDEIASLDAAETETSPGAVPEQVPVLPISRIDEPPQQPAPAEPPPRPAREDTPVRRADTPTSRVDQTPQQPTPTEPPAAAPTREPARRQAEQPAPSAPASARPIPTASTPTELTGNDELDAYIRMLETEPQNHVLRLSLARIGGQTGMPDLAVQQYKHLIKHNALLDEIVDDLFDLIAYNDDRQVLRRLHRTLGDVYTKQGRLREAIQEYGWNG